jgi:hypothetical protein
MMLFAKQHLQEDTAKSTSQLTIVRGEDNMPSQNNGVCKTMNARQSFSRWLDQ